MDVILTIHSINRWLIAAIAIIAAVKYTIGWLGRHDYQSMDQVLMRGITGPMDLHALLGIILLIGLGIEAYRIEHLIAMVMAIVILHLSVLWRNASDGVKYRNNLLVILLSMMTVDSSREPKENDFFALY
jgi:hypothetical protein